MTFMNDFHGMNVPIELPQVEVDCILCHLPVGSDLRQKLADTEFTVSQDGRRNGLAVRCFCTAIEARELLRVAREHCPEAVVEVLKGITQTSVKS